MRSILLLRHGQTSWNLAGRWQGWLDVELDDIGREQARRRARDLVAEGTRFVGVASSPLARALETATIVSGALGITEVPTHPGLRERNGGEWQGLTRPEIDAGWPGVLDRLRFAQHDAPPGGESTADVLTRVDGALAEIDASMPAGPILVVTHGGIARVLVNRMGTDQRAVFANVGGMWVEYEGGALRAGADLPPLADDPAQAEGRLPVAPEVVATTTTTTGEDRETNRN